MKNVTCTGYNLHNSYVLVIILILFMRRFRHHPNLLGCVVCRHDDHKEPEHVLQHPVVDKLGQGAGATARVECFIVDVEQHHDAQGDQRQRELTAEHVIQIVDELAHQPVPDSEHLDGGLQWTAQRVLQERQVGCRDRFADVAAATNSAPLLLLLLLLLVLVALLLLLALVALVALLLSLVLLLVAVLLIVDGGPAEAAAVPPEHGVRPHRTKRHRVPVADHDVRADGQQLVVDVPEVQIHPEAQQRKVRLHAAHAPVLQVHVEEEQQQRVVTAHVLHVEQDQPEHVDGHHEHQARGDHGRRVRVVPAPVRVGQRPVALVRLQPAPVLGHVPVHLVHHGHARHEAGGRHQPGVQLPVSGGHGVLAPAVQRAQAPRRDDDVQHAGGQQRGREPLVEPVVRQVGQEHAARAPEHRDRPHQHRTVRRVRCGHGSPIFSNK